MIHRNRRRATALLAAASSLAFAGPAWAADVLFRTQGGADVEVGQRVEQATGLTQIRLDSGAIVSFLDTAAYRIDADGSVELFSGSVTVAGAPTGTTVIRMPEGVEGRVGGTGSAASFSVAADGSSNGHVMSGLVQIVRGGNPRDFSRGEMWQWARQSGLRLVVANGPQATPDADVALADMSEGGPAAAAENGVPVTLGDALAAAGASGDVIAAARRVEAAAGNPDLQSFPSGDLALLVAYAAQLEGLYGGRPFPGAGADIIRTYLGHLAAGGSGANFLTAYAGFMAQYLDLLRTGALPSSFQAASLTDINSFIAYLGQTSGFGSLSPANRTLVEAYLAFLQGGGNPDLFAGNYTNLVNAYFAYLRTGGDPAAFTGATQATLNAYIAFLSDSGLLAQLSAPNRALLQAYLANGGFAFVAQYRTALDAYFAYLAAGNLPSGYGAIDAATLRAYLETLQASGLFEQVLGARAEFYAGYLAYLQAGGAIDGYAGLNANVFAGYASQLSAFFAFIQGGGLPQGYDGDVEALFAYLAALEEAGALEAFLGDSAGFYAEYLAFVQGGGDPNLFAQLPGLNLDSFAAALSAYALFIQSGGLPSGYSEADLDLLATYIAILRNSGRLNELLGANASVLNAYFLYLADGGSADGFSGLPLYSGYVTALNAYYAFLAGGGLPEDYTGLTQEQIQAYLAALQAAGGFAAYGELQAFFADYYAFLAGGGSANAYAALPYFQSYLAALQAYYNYLLGGGLPSAYSALTQEQIEAYLALLNQYGVLQAAQSGTYLYFLVGYYEYVGGGGNPDQFAGLPVNNSGGTGNPPSAPTPLAGYAGGFNAPTANVNFIVAGSLNGGSFAGGESGFQTNDYSLGGSGALTSYTRGIGFGPTRTSGSTTTSEVFGNADMLIGRWHSGTNTGANPFTMNANQGFHYMLARPLEVTLPTSGRIDYYLVAATKPTIANGSYAPGTFAADMAILFGSQNRLAMEGSITMPTGGADYVFDFATPGGMANANLTDVMINANAFGSFSAWILGATDTGGNCATDCGLSVFASFAKDQNALGITYQGYVPVAGKSLVGAALFQSGPARTGTPTPTPTPTPSSNFTGERDAITYYTYRDGSLVAGFGGKATLEEGRLTSFTSLLGTISKGTAQVVEKGDLGDIAWARWTAGNVSNNGLFGNNTIAVGANGGFHVMAGTPSTTLPTGKVDYTLTASTSATDNQGSAPGTVGGSLAILFGSTSKVGYDLAMAVGGKSWAVSTNGGAADPSLSQVNLTTGSGGPTFGGTFTRTSGTVTAAGGACVASCVVNIGGALYGANGAHAGVAFNVIDTSLAATVMASGLAIFSAPGTATASNMTQAVPAAEVGMGQDWARWDGGTTTLDLPALTATPAGSLEIGATDAEAQLGGMITFGGAGAP
jgi:hypothetical protein